MPPTRRSARTASSATPYARTNRQTSPSSTRPSASIARPANGKTSLRLTVKAAPSKLREATSGSANPIPPNPYADGPSESDATPIPADRRTARTTRNPRRVVEPESDEEEEVEGEEEQDAEMEDVDQELLANEDSEEEDEDAEGEEDDVSENADEHPPPPIIKQHQVPGQVQPNVTVTAPNEGALKSVEDKEMEDDEDEELSELDSNEDAEGEGEGGEGEEDEEPDSSDEDGSRSATPDLSKLTRRQRGVFEEEPESSLMALSNEAQKKKHLTEAEQNMRRAEMARRRKNLSEKRNEEEKMSTIDKLLKKPAPKRRTRAEIIADQQAAARAGGTPGFEDGDEERPDELFVRWVNTKEGSRIGVPHEWLEAPVGEVFGAPRAVAPMGSERLIEEVA